MILEHILSYVADFLSTKFSDISSILVLLFFYLTAGAIALPTGSFGGALPVVLSDVECNGDESSILNCTENSFDVQCNSGEGAAIICQGKTYGVAGPCIYC